MDGGKTWVECGFQDNATGITSTPAPFLWETYPLHRQVIDHRDGLFPEIIILACSDDKTGSN